MQKTQACYFLNWEQAAEAGTIRAGGKGFNLGRLHRAGFTIPKGGVLATDAYHIFLQTNNLKHRFPLSIEPLVENAEPDEERLARIREQILDGMFPDVLLEELTKAIQALGLLGKAVAVRSSAQAEDSEQASFAGIHSSFLNVQSLESIIQAIKGCYASLWTPQAIAYRTRMKIAEENVVLAVVVMEMVESTAAGVGFSCDPQTGRSDVVVINANYGLGESVVSGSVEPDHYVLQLGRFFPLPIKKQIGLKKGITIPSTSGGTHFLQGEERDAWLKQGAVVKAQVLSDQHMVQLAMLIDRVYATLGEGEKHQDIEWAYDGKQFVLLQARSIAALRTITYPHLINQPVIWSNANYKDVMPYMQSPLSWSMIQYSTNSMLMAPFLAVGYNCLAGLVHTKLVNGRAYMNLTALQWEFYDAFGVFPREFNERLGGHQPEIHIQEHPSVWLKARRQWRLLHIFIKMLKVRAGSRRLFRDVYRFVQEFRGKDLASFTSEQLIEICDQTIQMICEFAPKVQLLNMLSALSFAQLLSSLSGIDKENAEKLANTLMAGRGKITSAEHGYRLYVLAELARTDEAALRFLLAEHKAEQVDWQSKLPKTSIFYQEFLIYLQEFGHRGIYELDLINPRWREDPSYLLDILRSLLMEHSNDIQRVPAKSIPLLLKELPVQRRWKVRTWLKLSIDGAEIRERAKSELVRPLEILRVLALEIGQRLQQKNLLKERDDVFYCTWGEIASLLKEYWNGNGLEFLIEVRKTKRKEWESKQPIDVFLDDEPQKSMQPNLNREIGPTRWHGLAIASGQATGTVKILRHPSEGVKLQLGDILVAPSTDPAWTPLFLKAAAIVMEVGGYLSHGSIVAREYGIPAVANIPGIIEALQDGQSIMVDGDCGLVSLL